MDRCREDCRDDLIIVVRRVRERAFAVAVAERPDAGNIRAQVIVDFDIAGAVGFHTGLVQAQIHGIRHSSDSEQQVRPDRLPAPLRTIETDDDPLVLPARGDTFGVQADRDAFCFQDFLHRRGNIFVFARNQARRFFDDRDLAPKRRYICANSRPI